MSFEILVFLALDGVITTIFIIILVAIIKDKKKPKEVDITGKTGMVYKGMHNKLLGEIVVDSQVYSAMSVSTQHGYGEIAAGTYVKVLAFDSGIAIVSPIEERLNS